MHPHRFKLDENVGGSLAAYLRGQGHDVETVLEEALGGRPDPDVWAACCTEDRYLITSDLDFADPRVFDPAAGPGIFVLRSRKQTTARFRALTDRVVEHLRTAPPRGELWIVTEMRIRPYDA